MTKVDFFAPPESLGEELSVIFEAIRADMYEEYTRPSITPWIVGFSGGKDSTLVAHLVFDLLLSLPAEDRKRQVHIVSNDTLVESPLVVGHIKAVQAEMRAAAESFGLPVTIATTQPNIDGTFWVNLIGRGYPSPNRSFRWCTDRMKIQPTSGYIRRYIDVSGEVILLLGVRRSESALRAGSVARYDNGERLNRHNDLPGCLVYRPIVELSTDQVWEFLGATRPPWGGSHAPLITLYRDALGGECPVVTQKSDAPSCGTSSSRFGCWTCTVVEKDRSLEGFVASGWSEFGPLLKFRDWLVDIRNEPTRRMARRRDGRITVALSGIHIPGPFTIETRQEILTRLMELQDEIGHALVSPDEVRRIHEIWAEDAVRGASWTSDLHRIGGR
jgi:DNA sulfur modification protein DndC